MTRNSGSKWVRKRPQNCNYPPENGVAKCSPMLVLASGKQISQHSQCTNAGPGAPAGAAEDEGQGKEKSHAAPVLHSNDKSGRARDESADTWQGALTWNRLRRVYAERPVEAAAQRSCTETEGQAYRLGNSQQSVSIFLSGRILTCSNKGPAGRARRACPAGLLLASLSEAPWE